MLLHFLNYYIIVMVLLTLSVAEIRQKRFPETVDAFFDTGSLDNVPDNFENIPYSPLLGSGAFAEQGKIFVKREASSTENHKPKEVKSGHEEEDDDEDFNQISNEEVLKFGLDKLYANPPEVNDQINEKISSLDEDLAELHNLVQLMAEVKSKRVRRRRLQKRHRPHDDPNDCSTHAPNTSPLEDDFLYGPQDLAHDPDFFHGNQLTATPDCLTTTTPKPTPPPRSSIKVHTTMKMFKARKFTTCQPQIDTTTEYTTIQPRTSTIPSTKAPETGVGTTPADVVIRNITRSYHIWLEGVTQAAKDESLDSTTISSNSAAKSEETPKKSRSLRDFVDRDIAFHPHHKIRRVTSRAPYAVEDSLVANNGVADESYVLSNSQLAKEQMSLHNRVEELDTIEKKLEKEVVPGSANFETFSTSENMEITSPRPSSTQPPSISQFPTPPTAESPNKITSPDEKDAQSSSQDDINDNSDSTASNIWKAFQMLQQKSQLPKPAKDRPFPPHKTSRRMRKRSIMLEVPPPQVLHRNPKYFKSKKAVRHFRREPKFPVNNIVLYLNNEPYYFKKASGPVEKVFKKAATVCVPSMPKKIKKIRDTDVTTRNYEKARELNVDQLMEHSDSCDACLTTSMLDLEKWKKKDNLLLFPFARKPKEASGFDSAETTSEQITSSTTEAESFIINGAPMADSYPRTTQQMYSTTPEDESLPEGIPHPAEPNHCETPGQSDASNATTSTEETHRSTTLEEKPIKHRLDTDSYGKTVHAIELQTESVGIQSARHDTKTFEHHESTDEHHEDEAKEHHEEKSEHHGEEATEHHGEKTPEHHDETTEHHGEEKSEHHGEVTKEHHEEETKEHHGEESEEHHGDETKEHHGEETKEHHEEETKEHHGEGTKEHHGEEEVKEHHDEEAKEHHGEEKEHHGEGTKEHHGEETKEHHDEEPKEHHDEEPKEHHGEEPKEHHDEEAKEHHGEEKEHHGEGTKEHHGEETKEHHDEEPKEHHDEEAKEHHGEEPKEHHDEEAKDHHGEEKEHHGEEPKEHHDEEAKEHHGEGSSKSAEEHEHSSEKEDHLEGSNHIKPPTEILTTIAGAPNEEIPIGMTVSQLLTSPEPVEEAGEGTTCSPEQLEEMERNKTKSKETEKDNANITKTVQDSSSQNATSEIASGTDNAQSKAVEETKELYAEIPVNDKTMQLSTNCTNTDYLAKDHCICSVNAMRKDLLDDIKDISTSSSYQYDCSKFIRIEPGIVIGNGSESRLVRKKRDPMDVFFESITLKDGARIGRDIESYLHEDVEFQNNGSVTYATVGSKITIPCGDVVQEDTANMIFAWSVHNGAPETAGNKPNNGSTLVIENVVPQDTNNYTCIATDSSNQHIQSYNHELIVVALPMFSIMVTVLLKEEDKCNPGDLEVLNLYYSVVLKNILCSNSDDICSVSIERPQCVKVGTQEVVSIRSTLQTVPIASMFPKLKFDACDLTCQSRLYSAMAGVLLKNFASATNLAVFFRLSYRDTKLTPIQNELGDKQNTISNSILPICPPGFGIYTNAKLCFACKAYSYNPGNEMKCISCPTGSYQPSIGEGSCLSCNSPIDDTSCFLPDGIADLSRKYYLFPLIAAACILFLICCCLCARCGKARKNKMISKLNKKISKLGAKQPKVKESSKKITAKSSEKSLRSVKSDSTRSVQIDKKKGKKIPPKLPPIDF